jgi:hypothetical protein
LLVQPGYGLSLWSRVATATSTLTITVSKAWSSNIVAYSGERTSSGFPPLVVTGDYIIGILNRLSSGVQIHHRGVSHALRAP